MKPTNLLYTLRLLRRSPLSSSINILGFAVGLGVCLLIARYIIDDFSFDQGFAHEDRIMRVVIRYHDRGERTRMAITQPPLAEALREQVPGIETAAYYRPRTGMLLSHDNSSIKADYCVLTEQSLFSIFSYKLLAGDRGHLLDSPHTIVLTRSTANRLFGSDNPVGQTVRVNARDDATVTGVIEDPSSHSHQAFAAMLSIEGRRDRMTSWTSYNSITYALLAPKTTRAQVAPSLASFSATLPDTSLSGFDLQPLRRIHLHSDEFQYSYDRHRSTLTRVYDLGLLGFLILLLAVVNFVNLSTARALLRAKEVGVRKATGATRAQLRFQFIQESMVVTLLAMSAGLLVAHLLHPWAEHLAGRTIGTGSLLAPTTLGLLFALSLLVGLVSGLYPAHVLSRFQAVTALKGVLHTGRQGVRMRRTLALFQFTLTLGLLITILVINRQLNYAFDKDTGFDRARVVAMPQYGKQFDAGRTSFQKQLAALPGVGKVGTASTLPFLGYDIWGIQPEGTSDSEDNSAYVYSFDPAACHQFGLQLLRGRLFSEQYATDPLNPDTKSGSALVTRSFARKYGWDNPVGRIVHSGKQTFTVVGEVEDFLHGSLREEMGTTVVIDDPEYNKSYTVATLTGDIKETQQKIETLWDATFPAIPFTSDFLDAIYEAQYRSERAQRDVLTAATGLALTVALLGLLGLVAFITQRRTREIGIRKVLGASERELVGMMVWEYVLLVLGALVVASPLAWLVSHHFLEGFADRIAMPWDAYLLAGAGVLLLTLLVTGLFAYRAAGTNPAKVLRSE